MPLQSPETTHPLFLEMHMQKTGDKETVIVSLLLLLSIAKTFLSLHKTMHGAGYSQIISLYRPRLFQRTPTCREENQ